MTACNNKATEPTTRRGDSRRRYGKPTRSLFLLLALFCCKSSVWLLFATIPCHVTATSSSFSRDYYKVLGVTRDCNQKDLQRAYRKLALRHHPDKGGKEENFKEINEAYDVLSDDTKRRQYDQFGTTNVGAAFGGGGGGGTGTPNFNFGQQHHPHHQQQHPHQGGPQFTSSSFFSFGGNPQQAGPNPFQNFGMFFDQAGPPGSGGATHVDLGDMLRQMMMGGAAGGWSTPSSTQTNPRRRRQPETSSANSYTRNVSCSLEELARGATKKLRVRHKVHDQWHEEMYQIQLQPHWKTGTKVRFPARPVSSSSIFPAMTFVIQQTPHAFLQRRGAHDVVYTCHITRRQAKQGLRLSIPCVLLPHDDDDHVMELVLKPETHPGLFPIHTGAAVAIPHRGMPRRRRRGGDRDQRHETAENNDDNEHDTDRGDLLVEFVVD